MGLSYDISYTRETQYTRSVTSAAWTMRLKSRCALGFPSSEFAGEAQLATNAAGKQKRQGGGRGAIRRQLGGSHVVA
jgi:hypothetical protein